MTPLVLGIDTSCYTTSVALAGDGRVVASWRKLLVVREGFVSRKACFSM